MKKGARIHMDRTIFFSIWLLLIIVVGIQWGKKGHSWVYSLVISLLLTPLVGLLIGVFLTPKKKRTNPKITTDKNKEINVEKSKTTSINKIPIVTQQNPDELKMIGEDTYIINPNSTFPLTLEGEKEFIYEFQKSIVESAGWGISYQTRMSLSYWLKGLIKCYELEEFINSMKLEFNTKLSEKKNNSAEWLNAKDELERKDIENYLRTEITNQLSVTPYINNFEHLLFIDNDNETRKYLSNLFLSLDSKCIYLLLKSYSSKSIIVKGDSKERKYWEELVAQDWAIKGKDISIEFIINHLKLRELQELVRDIDNVPTFRKRVEASEYFKNLTDAYERISSIIPLSSIFKIKEFPSSFPPIINIENQWKRARAEVELVVMTFNNSISEYANFNDSINEDKELHSSYTKIVGWKIYALDNCCPHCNKYLDKTFPIENPPLPPFHMGCRCSLTPIYKYEK